MKISVLFSFFIIFLVIGYSQQQCQTQHLEASIIQNEAVCPCMYYDSKGYPTIGIGYKMSDESEKNIAKNLLQLTDDRLKKIVDGEEALTLKEMKILLNYHLKNAYKEIQDWLPTFNGLTLIAQRVLIDLYYNMGITKLKGFKNMKAALDKFDYLEASKQIGDSDYCRKDSPVRCNQNMQLMSNCANTTNKATPNNGKLRLLTKDTQYINYRKCLLEFISCKKEFERFISSTSTFKPFKDEIPCTNYCIKQIKNLDESIKNALSCIKKENYQCYSLSDYSLLQNKCETNFNTYDQWLTLNESVIKNEDISECFYKELNEKKNKFCPSQKLCLDKLLNYYNFNNQQPYESYFEQLINNKIASSNCKYIKQKNKCVNYVAIFSKDIEDDNNNNRANSNQNDLKVKSFLNMIQIVQYIGFLFILF